jgi:phospholipid/cholesterol/gamma-HCH transport system substrate-binding protein
MSKPYLQTKVGAFVLVGIVLLALLVVLLNKGLGFYGQTFQLLLRTDNVGGLRVGANVMLSGVPVGRVSAVELSDDGRTVEITLRIFKKFKIYDDADFEIEQIGFLGDQIVSIRPRGSEGALLKEGDTVRSKPPFNLQETVARAADTVSKIGSVAQNMDGAVSDVRRLVLTEESLASFGEALRRFGVLSAEALVAVSNVNSLVGSNAAPLSMAVSNLNNFATELIPLAGQATMLVSNNTDEINNVVENVQIASVQLTNLLHTLRHNEGAVGRLVNDRQLANDLADLAYNLSITTSNLNRKGLWGIMWRQKDPPPPRPADSSDK